MEATLGITGLQRLVLKIVSDAPGFSAGELAEVVHRHPSTVSGILQPLVAKGLLVRDRDASDRRRVRLRVAHAARVFTMWSRGTVESAIARAFRRAPAQVQHAHPILSAIGSALCDAQPSGGRRPRSSRRVV
jgi:DNA-binding MarR family transcriptional regulator